MGGALLLSMVLTAAAGPVRVATTPVTRVEVSEEKAELFMEFFAQRLSEGGGLRVTTPKEIATLLGMERQRQLLGCSDDSTNCLAELAGALGVDAVVVGSLGKVGEGYTITLRVVDAVSAAPLASGSTRVKSEDALLDWLGETAGRFNREVRRALRPEDPPAPTEVRPPAVARAPEDAPRPPGVSPAAVEVTAGSPSLRSRAWIPAAAAGALAVAGGVFWGLSAADANTLRTGSPEPQDVEGLARAGEAKQWAARGLFAGAGLAAAAAVGMYLLGEDAQVAVTPGPGGVAVQGRWP